MRLINADAVIPKLKSICEGENQIYGCGSWRFAIKCLTVVENAPTIEPRPEIVRCKDCKHWHREIYNSIEYFTLSSCNLNHRGDGHNFYCADAERKEGEKDEHTNQGNEDT